jgi:acyl-coenzyme A thioesterase PaaI-like protein
VSITNDEADVAADVASEADVGNDAAVAIADARADAGLALRQLAHALIGHGASVDDLRKLADDLNTNRARLTGNAPRSRLQQQEGRDWSAVPADGEAMFSYDDRPISGRSAPWGLDMDVVRVGREAIATLTLGPVHEGAPGRSHGGVVAALFDDVFGFVIDIESELPAFTGELTIRYERATPLHVPLECRVRMERREGRKMHFTGELTSDPVDESGERVVHARSRALFITVNPESFLPAHPA